MKYLILGAGPAGLSFACYLKKMGETSFMVIEKEEDAGGLCRSKMVDGSPMDIGGGHFLDTARKDVTDFLFQYMSEEEWNYFKRDSRISIHGTHIHHPFEANIWELDIEKQIEYIKSIFNAGCNQGVKEPAKFTDWIYWKLGRLIGDNYMIPYNKKMFGEDLDLLGTYWLNKLPNVSFDETLRSCLEHKPYGKQPGHAEFLYPKKYGYGEIWKRMALSIKDNILYNTKAEVINVDKKCVNDQYSAENIIFTIPYQEITTWVGTDEKMKEDIKKLKYSSIRTEYRTDKIETDAHWIYYPDLETSFHRKLIRKNFCMNSSGYWTETNIHRTVEQSDNVKSFDNQYAYPLNTIEKPNIMKYMLSKLESHNIYGLGRWGEWEHYNSDVTVKKAIQLCEKLLIK